jgi:ATP-binding cassette subfamily B protein
VGRTGAGKSSILNLVSGLYEPWQGTVRVAGRNPRQVEDPERRRLIGIVPQTVQLFSGTVWDNLTLGEAGVPRRAVEAAVQLGGADSLIRNLPDGYDTLISQGSGCGVKLSTGQRQLLSVARALVGDPAVLLFDEATSGIDSTREAVLREALQSDEIRQKHAILTVAHRLSTARTADRVIVLDGGRIVEQGTPDELLRQGGHFAALLELETSGWDWRSLTLEAGDRPGSHRTARTPVTPVLN